MLWGAPPPKTGIESKNKKKIQWIHKEFCVQVADDLVQATDDLIQVADDLVQATDDLIQVADDLVQVADDLIQEVGSIIVSHDIDCQRSHTVRSIQDFFRVLLPSLGVEEAPIL